MARNETVEDLVYVGRSPVSGAQHFRILTSTGVVAPTYEPTFLPNVDAAAQEAPAFMDSAKQAARRKLVTVGDSPLPDHEKLPQLAAVTTVTRAVLNLHETITRN